MSLERAILVRGYERVLGDVSDLLVAATRRAPKTLRVVGKLSAVVHLGTALFWAFWRGTFRCCRPGLDPTLLSFTDWR